MRRILSAVISKAPVSLLRGDALIVRKNLDIQKKTEARTRLKNAVQGWKGALSAEDNGPTQKSAAEMVASDPKTLPVDDLERLGMIYFKGEGVQQDAKKAYNTWLAAAERGSPGAAFSVSGCLLSGMGVKKDEKKAFDIVKDLAENRNYPLAHVKHIRYIYIYCNVLTVFFSAVVTVPIGELLYSGHRY